MKMEKKINKKYKGQISGILSPILEKQRLKKVCEWIKGDKILDCGCGTGKLLTLIPHNMKYTGIDADKRAIEKAKKQRENNTEFYILHIGKDTFPVKKKYDTIVLSAFIEHLDNSKQVLMEIREYLSNNGRIIVTTPIDKAEIILRIGSKLRLFGSEAFHEHKQHFSKENLIKLMNECGLEIIHYECFELGFNHLIVVKKRLYA